MADSTEHFPLWPLTEFEVQGLFGRSDLRMALDHSATVLTGENGSGKSTLLNAIHLIGEGHWRHLVNLPLHSVRLTFADGYFVDAQIAEAHLHLSDNQGGEWQVDLGPGARISLRNQRELEYLRHQLERAATPTERLRARQRYDTIRRRIGDLAEDELLDVPDWVPQLTSRFRTKLISARRLEHRLRPDESRPGEEQPVSVVDQFASELGERMRDQLSVYAGESRRQEKVLPSQIVQAMLHSRGEAAHDIANEVDALRAEVRRLADSLARVGLFQEEDPDPQFVEYPRDDLGILLAIREVYRVTLQRLQRLTDLRAELELLASFLNTRLTHKRVELSQRTGIDVVLDTNERIKPSQLSSGEQQLLALAYELLFRTDPYSVVLLDEPELSLHVAWLQGLLSAFVQMGASRDLEFVIATHSPSVIAGHLERERSLDTLTVHGAV